MTTTTPTLTPAQVHELGIIAARRQQNITQLFNDPSARQLEFEDYLTDAYDTFLSGDKDRAMSKIKITINACYNFYVELRTESNLRWIHSVFLEISGDEALAKGLFYPEALTEQEGLDLAKAVLSVTTAVFIFIPHFI